MFITKGVGASIAILLAVYFAYYIGRNAGSTDRFGGVVGTILAFSFYGILPWIIFIVIYEWLVNKGIWYGGGDNDIGLGLAPLLVAPAYWVAAFGGIYSKRRKN